MCRRFDSCRGHHCCSQLYHIKYECPNEQNAQRGIHFRAYGGKMRLFLFAAFLNDQDIDVGAVPHYAAQFQFVRVERLNHVPRRHDIVLVVVDNRAGKAAVWCSKLRLPFEQCDRRQVFCSLGISLLIAQPSEPVHFSRLSISIFPSI